MNLLRFAVTALLSCALCAGAGPLPEGLNLDRLLSQQRQREIGVDKLTPAQRDELAKAILNAYLAGRDSVMKEKEATATQPAVRPKPQADVIETTIDDDFEGWEGDTVVKLSNGQVWIQTDSEYEYMYAYRPDVIIYRSGGSFKMKVDGVSKAVSVRRLK